MIQRNITYFGQQIIVACDEKCNKAWGINNRPKIQFDDNNEDDYAYLSDDELNEAPIDPGTYEGFEMSGKPEIKEERLNKWCIRECERSYRGQLPIELKDFSKKIYNIPSLHIVNEVSKMDYSVWITLDNKHLKISEMTTDHIKNCIKMIKRSKFLDVMERYDTVPEPPPRYVVDYDQYKPYLNIFKNELETR